MFSDFFDDWSILDINEILLCVLIKCPLLKLIKIFFIIFKTSKFTDHLINKSSDSSLGIRTAVFVVVLFELCEIVGDSVELNGELVYFFSSKINSIWNLTFIHICSNIIDCFSALISFRKNYYKIFLVSFMLLLDRRELVIGGLLLEVVFAFVVILLFEFIILIDCRDLALAAL